MKEIHAYKNADGTYCIEGIREMLCGKKLVDATVRYSRAQISIEPLVDNTDGVLFDIIIQEEE